MQTDHTPLVSIIIPAYNAAKFIKQCIQSIVFQTYKVIEIIIVNDGSTDETQVICETFAVNDKRIQVINKKNEGVTRARLRGFFASKGSFIMFVDADDYIHPECIEKLVNAANAYRADMVCCQYFNVIGCACVKSVQRPAEGFYNKDKIIKLLKEKFLYDKKTQIAGMNPFLCTKLIRRKFVADALRVGTGLWYEEDLVGTLQLLYSIDSMYITSDYLYYYVQHKEQVTKKFDPAMWNNAVQCWLEISKVDRNNYLSKQLPERMMLTIFDILKKCSRERYIVFKEYFLMIRNSDVSEKLLNHNIAGSLNYKGMIKLFLFRKSWIGLLHFMFNLKNRTQRASFF